MAELWFAILCLIFTIFAVLNRAYSSPYGTLPGEVVLALVTALYAAGLGWLYRLGAMSTPGRFLAAPGARPDQPGRSGGGDLTTTGRHR